MARRCETCLWWIRDKPSEPDPRPTWGECYRFVDAEALDDSVSRSARVKILAARDSATEPLARAWGSGYEVDSEGLATSEKFGCVQWEAK